jgi:hypothetical protein
VNETALAYALEVGNPDVRATLSWLAENGFHLTAACGGRHESFGNIQLVFRGTATVEILRDRLQWDLRVGLADVSTLPPMQPKRGHSGNANQHENDGSATGTTHDASSVTR